MGFDVREVLQLADALADRFEAMDDRAKDFGRANELVAYRAARAAVVDSPLPESEAERLRAGLRDWQEAFRQEVLARPPETDERNTFADGYTNGLIEALGMVTSATRVMLEGAGAARLACSQACWDEGACDGSCEPAGAAPSEPEPGESKPLATVREECISGAQGDGLAPGSLDAGRVAGLEAALHAARHYVEWVGLTTSAATDRATAMEVLAQIDAALAGLREAPLNDGEQTST